MSRIIGNKYKSKMYVYISIKCNLEDTGQGLMNKWDEQSVYTYRKMIVFWPSEPENRPVWMKNMFQDNNICYQMWMSFSYAVILNSNDFVLVMNSK